MCPGRHGCCYVHNRACVRHILIIHEITRRVKNNLLALSNICSNQNKAAKDKSVKKRSNSTFLLLMVYFMFIFCHLLLLVQYFTFHMIETFSSAQMFAVVYFHLNFPENGTL